MLDDLIQDLIDRVDHRYFGKYRGYVHDVADPEGLGRIRAIVPRLLGEDTPTGWALPCAPYAGPDQGFFTVPDVGSGVWIEFEAGDLTQPIWTGTWWGRPSESDVEHPDSTARIHSGADTEVPQHNYPQENATPLVRILKSSTGHHIVLDDRPDHERIEIHDSQGNRLILSSEGLDRIVSNERTYNKGSRSVDMDGGDKLEVAGGREVTVGKGLDETVRGKVKRSAGIAHELVVGSRYRQTIDQAGVTVNTSLPRSVSVGGSDTRTVAGAISDTAVGGIGMTSGSAINMAAATGINLTAGLPNLPSLNTISLQGGMGNVSINTFLGVMQLGGISAISPMVLGDGLLIHLTVMSQVAKAINPLTVLAYGPALDVWAAMTPLMTWSYYGYVKRFPVG